MMATGMPGQAVLKEEEMTSSQISTDVLRLYLLKRVPIFRRLMKLKEMVRPWNFPSFEQLLLSP